MMSFLAWMALAGKGVPTLRIRKMQHAWPGLEQTAWKWTRRTVSYQIFGDRNLEPRICHRTLLLFISNSSVSWEEIDFLAYWFPSSHSFWVPVRGLHGNWCPPVGLYELTATRTVTIGGILLYKKRNCLLFLLLFLNPVGLLSTYRPHWRLTISGIESEGWGKHCRESGKGSFWPAWHSIFNRLPLRQFGFFFFLIYYLK